VIAVLEFFLREPQREDERLVKVIATIAAQLDLVIERKLAEEALRDSEEALRQSYERIEDLAGRLIVAQEAERKHLARELHDDLSQQIAALAIGLGKLDRQLVGADGAVRGQITKLEDRVVCLSERIRQLSHELHSSTLEHVGLAEALRLHCSEFAAQEGITVDLEIQDTPGPLSADAALCLYRVAQESLRNIARHSGAKSAEVTLTSAGNLLELRVSDRGRGFDLKQAGRQSGLGLVSMQERVKLLHGSFEVRSQPGSGTELAVHLPLIHSSDSGVNHGKSKSAAG
jgi:signal transduction histidine kinase